MLTDKPTTSADNQTGTTATAPSPIAAAARGLDDLICYFEGDYVPMPEAKVSIMTHAFMYGTATFEGIRAYWNPDEKQLNAVFLREHLERIRNSCRILLMNDVPSVDELASIVIETVRRNNFSEDVYI